MKVKLGRLLGLIVIVATIVAVAPYALGSPPEPVTIDGGLFQQHTETLTVVVKGSDGKTVSRAIENLGGEVVTAGWLTDTVIAVLPADQLDALAVHPNVFSMTSADEGAASAD